MSKTSDRTALLATQWSARLNVVTNHVADHLDQPHSVEELAELAHLSKYHFHRIYRALTGETVQGMVSRLRLESAAAALVYEKSRSVTDVALAHGYSSSSNFAKVFAKHFGVSPSAFRSNSKIGKAGATQIIDTVPIELEVQLDYQPEVHLAYLRGKGKHLHLQISSMHQQVQRWVEEQHCSADDALSLGITRFDSLITDADDWIYDACVAVQPQTKGDGEIGVQILQAGSVATVEVELGENDNHDLTSYWDWLVRDWFLANDYELRASPSFEVYLQSANGFRVRLCLPLE